MEKEKPGSTKNQTEVNQRVIKAITHNISQNCEENETGLKEKLKNDSKKKIDVKVNSY